ncbi:hypothetical protein ACTFIU_001475 [Dictyostelium citrinum]
MLNSIKAKSPHMKRPPQPFKENSSYPKHSIVKFIFNTKKRSTISKRRRVNSYKNGGLNVWDLKVRETAQKAWIYERYRHQIKNKTPSSFHKIWSREETIVMGNINPSAPNHHLSCTSLHMKKKRSQSIKNKSSIN